MAVAPRSTLYSSSINPDEAWNGYLKNYDDTSNYLNGLPGQRDAGTKKIQDENGYSGQMQNLEGVNKQVLNTQQMLDNLGTNVKQRTDGSLTTAAQRARIQQSEQDPLTRQLGELSRTGDFYQGNLSRIGGLVNQYLTNFQNDSTNQLNNMQSKGQGYLTKYGGDLTARNQEAQNALARQQMQNEMNNARLAREQQQSMFNTQMGNDTSLSDLQKKYNDLLNNGGKTTPTDKGQTNGVHGLTNFIKGGQDIHNGGDWFNQLAQNGKEVFNNLGSSGYLIDPKKVQQSIFDNFVPNMFKKKKKP